MQCPVGGEHVPTSAPYAIPVIVNAVRQVRPRSILDVGTGFGKYGMLFREYTDIWHAEQAGDRCKEGWRTRIEGIEVHKPYLNALHGYIYNEVHVGNAMEVIDRLGTYDLVFMGDVLEHFEKEDGQRMIRKLYEHANKCVLLTYPRQAKRRDGFMGNPAEAHLSDWSRGDFDGYPSVAYTVLEGRADVAALAKPPCELPFLVGSFAARRRTGWKGKIASALVRTLGPSAASSLASRLLGRRIALRTE